MVISVFGSNSKFSAAPVEPELTGVALTIVDTFVVTVVVVSVSVVTVVFVVARVVTSVLTSVKVPSPLSVV